MTRPQLISADGFRASPAAARLAASLDERADELAALWWRLGADGPTCGAAQAGDEEFSRRRYLRPLARLLVGALRGGKERQAVYLDERLRYLPSGLGAGGRASFLARLLAAESKLVAGLAASAMPPDVTRSLLASLHAPLAAPPSGDPLRLLLIGDSIFTGTRAFLAQADRAQPRPLDVEHLNPGELTAAGLAIGHVLDAISRRPPHLIGLSLFSYGGVPAYPVLLAQRLPTAPGSAHVQGLGRLVQGAVDSIREATDAPILRPGRG